MGNTAVKTIVLFMLLVVASFIVGAQVADNIRDSLGAFVIVGAVVFGALLMLLGERSWMLIFVLPTFLGFLPLASLKGFPMGFMLAAVILLYWSAMSVLGHAKMRWVSLPIMDGLMLLFFVYMCANFIRHPVVMLGFDVDYDYMGGKEYLWVLGGTIYYIALSLIPCPYNSLCKLFKILFWVNFGVSFVMVLLGAAGVSQIAGLLQQEEGESLAETALHGRFSLFEPIGSSLLLYVYAKYPVGRILTSWWKLAACFLSVGAILISGWRHRLVSACINLFFISLVRRELPVLICIGMVFYSGCFFMGQAGALESMPYGMQRVLTIVPGIKVSREAAQDAQGSTDYRTEMWGWALDPSKGYIKDYVWGDGYQQSKSAFQRLNIAKMRGTNDKAQSKSTIASSHLWHSGFITSLHEIGIVGSCIQYIMFLYVAYVALRLMVNLLPDPYFPYLGTKCVSALCFIVFYPTAAVGLIHLSNQFMTYVLMKILVVHMAKQGRWKPLVLRDRYVPMVIRELEN